MAATKTQKQPTQKPIILDEPIKREGGDITEVSLRQPNSGELRGLSLFDLLNMSVNSLQTLIPRISSPSITEAEFKNLCPADLVQLGTEVAGFLATKQQKQEHYPTE